MNFLKEKRRFYHIVSAIIFILMGLYCSGQKSSVALVNNGSSSYVIIVPKNSTKDETAAAQKLQKYVEIVSKAKIPVYDDSRSPAPKEILIGMNNRQKNKDDILFVKNNPEGFVIKTNGNNLVILGGVKKGNLYGVYTFLENNLGCRKYTPAFTYTPSNSNIVISNINYKDKPAIAVRAQNLFRYDEEYFDWHKLQVLEGMPGIDWGEWILGFSQIVPPNIYFKTHPEYFAQISGKRVSTQLCMSNKDVQNMIIERLKQEIAKNPDPLYWVIAQNDNDDYCQCQLCAPKNKREGSPQGSLLEMINNVADNFPNKVIGTHAYRYSLRPPANLKPRSNVAIIVSSIAAARNKNIQTEDNRYTAAFRDSFDGWLNLTDKVVVWDYTVQFTNYLAPFPNLSVLQPNIKYFTRKKMLGIFEQGSGGNFSDMRELKSYLISKLLWNPNIDGEATINDFITNYYGDAAPEISQYVKMLNQNAIASPKQLSIYGSVADGKSTYMTPAMMNNYKDLIRKAYTKVGNNPTMKSRIDLVNLTLLYADQPDLSGKPASSAPLSKSKAMAAEASSANNLGNSISEFSRIAQENGIRLLSEDGRSITY